MKPAYYIVYEESDRKTRRPFCSISRLHPLDYMSKYLDKYKVEIVILWWKELTENEVHRATAGRAISMFVFD